MLTEMKSCRVSGPVVRWQQPNVEFSLTLAHRRGRGNHLVRLLALGRGQQPLRKLRGFSFDCGPARALKKVHHWLAFIKEQPNVSSGRTVGDRLTDVVKCGIDVAAGSIRQPSPGMVTSTKSATSARCRLKNPDQSGPSLDRRIRHPHHGTMFGQQ